MADQTFTSESLALHSGDYVEKYNRKPVDRVRGLAQRMTVGPRDRIADFACGNGMLLQVLDGPRGTYHGVDFSPDFIASAQSWAQRSGKRDYAFACQDIVQFCADHPASFDIATTLDFSEHVDDRTAIPIYAAIARALKPGGRLYLHTPNLDFFMERAKDRGILRQFPEHIAVRTAGQTVDLLVLAGFPRDGIRVTHIAHYNILKYCHFLSSLPVIGKFFQARIWIEARI